MEKTDMDAVDQGAVTFKRGRGRPKIHLDVPSHLVCSITGERKKTTPLQFRRQVERSGLDRETFMATYVSRKGRRVLKERERALKDVVEAA